MNTAEKAKAYDEAVTKCKAYINDTRKRWSEEFSKATEEVFLEIFPQLAISDGEMIMEELIGALMWQRDCLDAKGPHDNNLILPGFTMKVGDILEWLEKQKEKKPATIEQVYEQFLSSDTLKSAKENKYIRAQLFWELMHNGIITEADYQYLTDDSRKPWTEEEYLKAYRKGFDVSEQLKQKEQKPLKVGENAYFDLNTDMWFIKKEQKSAEKQDYSGLNNLERVIHRGFLSAGVENVPVTIIKETAKECLAQMKPAEWGENDENMLNSIINVVCGIGSQSNGLREKQVNWLKSLPERFNLEPKEEWSDEDTEMYINVASSLRGYACGLENEEHKRHIQKGLDWLENRFKSLRPQPKQEWSEEDEKMYKAIIIALSLNSATSYLRSWGITLEDADSWLKSIRHQYHGDVTMTEAYKMGLEAGKASSWKPNEEQMEVLLSTQDMVRSSGYQQNAKVLASLYEQLKRLM